VEHVATLGAESDPDSPAASFVIARDSSGRFFVAPMSNRASIGIYARTGEYVDVFGRPGGGPGEFTYAQEVKVIRVDTVLVMDRAQLRYTILTSGLELVDVIRMAFPDDGAIAYGSRDIVAHASVESPERVGHALHHLVDGQPIRSFATTGNVLPGNAIDRRRRVARANDGGIWTAHVNRYRLELWDTTGAPVRVLEADRDWFPHWRDRRDAREERPWPGINGVWQDDGAARRR
jgi:hypothetical protein